jgi:hypothetical protein
MKLISREKLRARLERHGEFRLVMTLSAAAYASRHIPRRGGRRS